MPPKLFWRLRGGAVPVMCPDRRDHKIYDRSLSSVPDEKSLSACPANGTDGDGYVSNCFGKSDCRSSQNSCHHGPDRRFCDGAAGKSHPALASISINIQRRRDRIKPLIPDNPHAGGFWVEIHRNPGCRVKHRGAQPVPAINPF